MPKEYANNICNIFTEATATPIGDLDGLRALLHHIVSSAKKEPRELLVGYANTFSWQGTKLYKQES